MTAIVVVSVYLVVAYIAATYYLCGVTLNQISQMNLIFAVGIAVDFSVHIAHKYLVVKPPDSMSNSEKREYKVR